MEKLQQFIADLKATDVKIDALLDKDELTEAEQVELKKLEADRAKLKAACDKEQSRRAREQERALVEAQAAQIAARAERQVGTGLTTPDHAQPIAPAVTLPAPPVTPPRAWTIPADVRRFGPLRNFRGSYGGRSAEERAYRFGMFCFARLALDMPNRFNPRQRRFSDALKFYEMHWNGELQAAANQSNDGTGAQFLVPSEFGQDLIDLREQYGVVRQIFRRVPMASDTRTDPRRKGGLTAYFVGEGNAGTESNKNWDSVSLTAKKLMVLSRWTNEVNADSIINFGDDLAGEITYAFTQKEDDCGFNGDGTSTYGGIVGARTKLTGTGTAGVITQGSGNTWPAITLADFNAVMGKLPQYAYQAGPEWVAHLAFYHNVMVRLELAAGGVTAQEVRDGARVPIFLGYPVRVSQVMPSATGVSTLSCLFGAYRLGAAFGDRQQDEISFSEHASIGGESLWERGEMGVRGTERFDINVHDAGSSSVVGPIVGLKTGS